LYVMAYGRTSRRRRTIRRRPRRVTRRTRKTAPRYRTRKTRMMSRKRVLNITSEKKHDNMLPVSFTPTGSSASAGGYTVTGNSSAFMIWCPSYRDRIATDPTGVSTRANDTVFMRGLKESITIRTSGVGSTGNAASWLWRRILFTAKGLQQLLGTSVDHSFTSSGYVRFLANHNGTTFASNVSDLLFQGVINTDWLDIMTAKTDTTRLNVIYDKTTRLVPQSAARQYWKYKRWHPFNKNLVYANEENGSTETNSGYSTLGKPGMGDIYVVDMFQCASNDVSDTIFFSPEACLYWHEK